MPVRRFRLTISQVLGWADEHHDRTGRWPRVDSGHVRGPTFDTWRRINEALRKGLRGLPSGGSLARLLADYRQVRNPAALPPLTLEQIVEWADRHFQRTGRWPTNMSGPIPGAAPGETWAHVAPVMASGGRRLPYPITLAKLLELRRGKRHLFNLPPFTKLKVLRWADDHYRRTGRWPTARSGSIHGVAGETWAGVNEALKAGKRGLPAVGSLAILLFATGRKMHLLAYPRLSYSRILDWADAHHRRTGQWPKARSGPVRGQPDEVWKHIDTALRAGVRGLPGGSSLARLLAARRNVRNPWDPGRLVIQQILEWADARYRRTGSWPTTKTGPVRGAPGETWLAIQSALSHGNRGLPGGDSLARLLDRKRRSLRKGGGRYLGRVANQPRRQRHALRFHRRD